MRVPGVQRATGAAVCAALLPLQAIALPHASAAALREYFWRWSDGSRAEARTFADPGDSPHSLPRLVVTARPPVAGVPVLLQFRDRGRWVTEDEKRTDRSGAATLQLNPYCADGGWCRTTFDYRLVIDGEAAAVRVTYAR